MQNQLGERKEAGEDRRSSRGKTLALLLAGGTFGAGILTQACGIGGVAEHTPEIVTGVAAAAVAVPYSAGAGYVVGGFMGGLVDVITGDLTFDGASYVASRSAVILGALGGAAGLAAGTGAGHLLRRGGELSYEALIYFSNNFEALASQFHSFI